jgi:hypothetical protein
MTAARAVAPAVAPAVAGLVSIEDARERVRVLVEAWTKDRTRRRLPVGDQLRHEAYGSIPVDALKELKELRHWRWWLLTDHAMAHGTEGGAVETPPTRFEF